MNKSWVRKKKTKIILYSMVAGVVFWVVDAFVDCVFFHNGNFIGLCLTDIPARDLWMRVYVVVTFVTLGLVFSKYLIKLSDMSQELRDKDEELISTQKQLKAATEIKEKASYDLEKRVKELNCLYNLFYLFEQTELSLHDMLQRAVEMIAPAWHYSQNACARIVFEGESFVTNAFSQSKWGLSAAIDVFGEDIGFVEVYYNEEKPKLDEGPFYKEEIKLIKIIAERLGRIIERKWSENALEKSEKRYKRMASNVPGVVYQLVLTPDGEMSFPFVGESCKYILDIDPEEVKRDAGVLFNILHADGKEGLYLSLAQSAKSLVPWRWEGSAIVLGEQRWFKAFSQPEKQDNGDIIWDGVIVDITEFRKSSEALEEAYNELKQVFNTAANAMCILDTDFNFLRVNDMFSELFHVKRDHLIGRKCYEVWDRKVCEAIAQIIHGKERIEYSMDRELKDGSKISGIVTAVPLYNTEKEVVSIVASFKDITERKKLEQSRRLAQLGELASDVAHEVNNFLQIISGRAQLSLMDEKVPRKKVKENLEIIDKQCDIVKDIVQRLLKFSRPTKGDREEADINKSIEFAVNLVEHQLMLNNIKIDKKFTEYLPSVKINEKQMQEIFVNLFKNAADAMPEGGTITVSTAKEGNNILIDFIDQGEGISEEDIKKIFDPFFTTKENGTGLGLSVSLGIVKAHGGDLVYKSAKGKGTTASITLPVARKDKEKA